MSTMTLPMGRVRTPRLAIAAQTRMPARVEMHKSFMIGATLSPYETEATTEPGK